MVDVVDSVLDSGRPLPLLRVIVPSDDDDFCSWGSFALDLAVLVGLFDDAEVSEAEALERVLDPRPLMAVCRQKAPTDGSLNLRIRYLFYFNRQNSLGYLETKNLM